MRSLPLAIASAVAAFSFVACVLVATAGATVPCWHTVIADWSSDGTIGGSYPAACYRQAMQNAPIDLKIYSTLEDDLQSALQSRSARRLARVHAPVATLDARPRSFTLGLGALIVGLGVFLAVCSTVAVLVRRRVVRS